MAGDLRSADDKSVLAQSIDGYCRITLNRPKRLNALNAQMLTELHAALHQCENDDAIRAILITGSGRGFCAGQDLNERDPRIVEWPPDLERMQTELFHPAIHAIKRMAKPVIVAVNGIAAGAGASLALAGDIVLAARSAQFIQSFTKVGLSVDAGGGWYLTHALGAAKARGWLMTAGAMGAAEAAQAGLIWKCIDDNTLLPEAQSLASLLAKGPTRAYAAIKAAVAAAEATPNFESYLQEEAHLQGEMGRTADYREGVLAFLERRPADFKGS
jgi:2-(1,2-epoxy-1,2-dihydrophenyl)acetyl-CoA isomerase